MSSLNGRNFRIKCYCFSIALCFHQLKAIENQAKGAQSSHQSNFLKKSFEPQSVNLLERAISANQVLKGQLTYLLTHPHNALKASSAKLDKCLLILQDLQIFLNAELERSRKGINQKQEMLLKDIADYNKLLPPHLGFEDLRSYNILLSKSLAPIYEEMEIIRHLTFYYDIKFVAHTLLSFESLSNGIKFTKAQINNHIQDILSYLPALVHLKARAQALSVDLKDPSHQEWIQQKFIGSWSDWLTSENKINFQNSNQYDSFQDMIDQAVADMLPPINVLEDDPFLFEDNSENPIAPALNMLIVDSRRKDPDFSQKLCQDTNDNHVYQVISSLLMSLSPSLKLSRIPGLRVNYFGSKFFVDIPEYDLSVTPLNMRQNCPSQSALLGCYFGQNLIYKDSQKSSLKGNIVSSSEVDPHFIGVERNPGILQLPRLGTDAFINGSDPHKDYSLKLYAWHLTREYAKIKFTRLINKVTVSSPSSDKRDRLQYLSKLPKLPKLSPLVNAILEEINNLQNQIYKDKKKLIKTSDPEILKVIIRDYKALLLSEGFKVPRFKDFIADNERANAFKQEILRSIQRFEAGNKVAESLKSIFETAQMGHLYKSAGNEQANITLMSLPSHDPNVPLTDNLSFNKALARQDSSFQTEDEVAIEAQSSQYTSRLNPVLNIGLLDTMGFYKPAKAYFDSTEGQDYANQITIVGAFNPFEENNWLNRPQKLFGKAIHLARPHSTLIRDNQFNLAFFSNYPGTDTFWRNRFVVAKGYNNQVITPQCKSKKGGDYKVNYREITTIGTSYAAPSVAQMAKLLEGLFIIYPRKKASVYSGQIYTHGLTPEEINQSILEGTTPLGNDWNRTSGLYGKGLVNMRRAAFKAMLTAMSVLQGFKAPHFIIDEGSLTVFGNVSQLASASRRSNTPGISVSAPINANMQNLKSPQSSAVESISTTEQLGSSIQDRLELEQFGVDTKPLDDKSSSHPFPLPEEDEKAYIEEPIVGIRESTREKIELNTKIDHFLRNSGRKQALLTEQTELPLDEAPIAQSKSAPPPHGHKVKEIIKKYEQQLTKAYY